MIDPISKRLLERQARAATERSILVLMYHSTTGRSIQPVNRYSTTAAALADQLDLLEEYGWQTALFSDLANPESLGPRTAVLTFDDGYADNFEGAFLPIVERRMCATWFVVSGRIGRRAEWMKEPSQRLPLLDDAQLREMDAYGMEIGSHTVDHPDLTALAPDRVAAELRDSKQQLADLLGTEVTSFAYPYGRYGDTTREAVRDAGYTMACNTRPGWYRPEEGALEVRRVTVFREDSLSTFARKLLFAANDTGWKTMTRYVGGRLKARAGLTANTG